jgi:hypothetical protein
VLHMATTAWCSPMANSPFCVMVIDVIGSSGLSLPDWNRPLVWIRRLPYLAILGEHNEVTGYSLFTIAQSKTMATDGGDAGPGLAWCY